MLGPAVCKIQLGTGIAHVEGVGDFLSDSRQSGLCNHPFIAGQRMWAAFHHLYTFLSVDIKPGGGGKTKNGRDPAKTLVRHIEVMTT